MMGTADKGAHGEQSSSLTIGTFRPTENGVPTGLQSRGYRPPRAGMKRCTEAEQIPAAANKQ